MRPSNDYLSEILLTFHIQSIYSGDTVDLWWTGLASEPGCRHFHEFICAPVNRSSQLGLWTVGIHSRWGGGAERAREVMGPSPEYPTTPSSQLFTIPPWFHMVLREGLRYKSKVEGLWRRMPSGPPWGVLIHTGSRLYGAAVLGRLLLTELAQ